VMNPTRNLLPAVAALGALAALAAGCSSKGAAPAKAENPAYMFPHTPHVENDVNCLECHKGVEASSKLDPAARHVKLNPKSKVCGDCHGDEIAKIQPPKRAPEFTLVFDHSTHVKRVEGKCQACHQRLPEKGDDDAPAPAMSACTACHNHRKDFAEARCSRCHVDLRAYPLKPVSEYAHAGDFKRNHGALARTSAAACANCHDQTHCADCHSPATTPAAPAIRWPEQVERDFIHRGDFVSRHMIEAGSNPASCARCHGSAFCESCHKQANVAAPTAPFASGERDPHPAGWGTGPEHGRAARRNIVICSSCHASNADQVCVMCHRDVNPATTGESRNPHPPGFLKRADKDEWNSNRVCRTCHG
jgi:hypothetical protein